MFIKFNTKNHKDREVINVRIIIIFICVLALVVCGCSKGEDIDVGVAEPPPDISSNSDTVQEEEIVQEEDTVEDVQTPEKENPSYGYFGDPGVFDFADLREEDFPRGTWTVNQLKDRYGTPIKCIAKHYAFYKVVSISVEFENIVIGSGYKDQAEFSFYEESMVAYGEYPLDSPDMDIEIDINVLLVSDPNVSLPYGLKFSQSTKAQLIDAYQEKNSMISDNPGKIPYMSNEAKYGYSSSIAYVYATPDENGIFPDDRYQTGLVVYYLDEEEVLKFAEVAWQISGE